MSKKGIQTVSEDEVSLVSALVGATHSSMPPARAPHRYGPFQNDGYFVGYDIGKALIRKGWHSRFRRFFENRYEGIDYGVWFFKGYDDAAERSPWKPCKWTPLHGASSRGQSYLVRAYLNLGVYVDDFDEEGRTPRDVAKNDGIRAIFDITSRKIEGEEK